VKCTVHDHRLGTGAAFVDAYRHCDGAVRFSGRITLRDVGQVEDDPMLG
jgi:hypothetical protein